MQQQQNLRMVMVVSSPEMSLTHAKQVSSFVSVLTKSMRHRMVCPKVKCLLQNCIAQTEVFHASKGGAQLMAKDMQVPFLGRVPLDPLLSRAAEEGRSAFGSKGGSVGNNGKELGHQFMPSLPALQAIIQQLMQLTEGTKPPDESAMQNERNGTLHL